MKIKKLHINNFKNLNNIDIDLSDNEGMTVFVGENGSGKSNILELFSEIFFYRYKFLGKEREKNKIFPRYSIEYSLFDGTEVKLSVGEDNKQNAYTEEVLPKRIVAIYTGEEHRLYDKYYLKHYNLYVRNMIKSMVNLPRMIYLDCRFWNISLFSLLMNNSEESKNFVKDILHIQSINSITFNIDFETLEKYRQTTLTAMFNIIKTQGKLTFSLEEIRKLWEHYDVNEIFKNLYIAFLPRTHKLLKNLEITFNENLTLTDLSEGEKKQLLIKAAMEYVGSEDSLFLLDEPDSSVHLNNKHKIFDLLKEYSSNRSIILTTHSPIFTSNFEPKQIVLLNNGKVEPFKDSLEAARKLCVEDPIRKILFSNKLILCTEGKTDKDYIEKAISLFKKKNKKYCELNFEVFIMGGTDSETYELFIKKFTNKQKFIILVDRDSGGSNIIERFTNGNKKFIDKATISNLYNNVCLVMLPNKSGESNDEFTIEDFISRKTIRQYFCNQVKSFDKGNKNIKNFFEKFSQGEFKKKISKKCKDIDDFENFSDVLDLILEAKKKLIP